MLLLPQMELQTYLKAHLYSTATTDDIIATLAASSALPSAVSSCCHTSKLLNLWSILRIFHLPAILACICLTVKSTAYKFLSAKKSQCVGRKLLKTLPILLAHMGD